MLQSSHLTRGTKLFVLLGISLGYFMVLLDTTVVNVALPAIHADLGGRIANLQWVVNAYTIVFAGLLLSMGTMTDKWGAKRVFIGGLLLILAASVIAAAVTSLATLIIIRAVLGIGGAALLPASMTLIAHAFPEPSERARALGIWAAVTGIALAAGPVVGGLLVDSLGWRSIFLLNIPIALVSVVLTWRLIHDTTRNPQRSLDFAGQLFAILSIAALSFAMMEGETYGWVSPWIMGSFGTALVCMVLLIIVESRKREPLFPLHLLRNSTLSAGMVAGMIVNIGFSGILFVVPLFFQQVRGLSAHTAGLSLLPMMIPMAINPIITGRIVSRIGPKVPMTAGFGFAAIGTWLLVGMDENASYWLIAAGLLLLGYGISLTLPSLVAAVISSAPKEQMGIASALLNSSRQLGATLGVAMMGMSVSAHVSFLSGMHAILIVIVILLFSGSFLSYRLVGRERKL